MTFTTRITIPITLVTSAAGLCTMAMAETINIPAVEIVELTHDHFNNSGQTITRDAVTFPCVANACSGPGFTASIGTGDVLIARFEAPTGHRFVVTRQPGGNQFLFFNARWRTGGGDVGSVASPTTITFEHLVGPAPSSNFTQSIVFDNGQAISTQADFLVHNDFSFTAIQVQISVNQSLPDLSRTYLAVQSSSVPSFGSSRLVFGSAENAVLMQIVPICAADTNNDGSINVTDLLAVINAWGACTLPCPPQCAADTNGDCAIDVSDLLAVINAWGPCP